MRPMRPDKLARLGNALRRWGRSPAAGFITGAIRNPDAPAIIDELGTLTFKEIDERTNALAAGLADAGVKEGDGVAIMCRNHRGFVEATVANAKLGANSLYLNTAFAGPQITEVVKREKPVAIVFDQEFTDLLEDAGNRRKRFVGWVDDPDALDDPTLEQLIEDGPTEQPVPPENTGKMIILTSGTTGTPKGANRGSPDSLDPAVSFLSKIPLEYRATSHIAAPLFHSWGFAHFSLGLLLGTTMVLTRKFEPEESLRLIAQSKADALVVVPVMMSRILELPEETRAKYDVSSLKVVAASGSALPGDLATEWMDAFGDTLYNLYGSTEVAWATIATPNDMREAPGTAGKPPRGTVLKLLDDKGVEVPQGETGRIFVANTMMFEGYTGGGSKDMIDGLMSTGDVGRMDDAGRLFVEGRDDEMIVSGGENLFPKEVEDMIARHKAVSEAAVHRRGRQGLRPAPARVRGDGERPERRRGRDQEARQVQPGGLQGAARDLVPGRAAAQRDRQGAQARAEGDGDRAEVAPRPAGVPGAQPLGPGRRRASAARSGSPGRCRTRTAASTSATSCDSTPSPTTRMPRSCARSIIVMTSRIDAAFGDPRSRTSGRSSSRSAAAGPGGPATSSRCRSRRSRASGPGGPARDRTPCETSAFAAIELSVISMTTSARRDLVALEQRRPACRPARGRRAWRGRGSPATGGRSTCLRPPPRHLGQRELEHAHRQRLDQPGLLGLGDEPVRGQQSVLGVLPAHQRLGAHHRAGAQVHLGLEVQHELVALQRAAHLALEADVPPPAGH